MNNKGYLQISFGWLFAIIAGAFILFLAIYGVTKFINMEETTLSAKTGKEIGILLNPLETGFGTTAEVTFFTMPVETRIYNKCNNYGDFGKQIIQVSQKSFNKWTETNIDIGFANKYIFSEKETEGKKFYIFSKPFEFPFKVADLIYIIPSTKKYCFIDPPEDIEDEIDALNKENLLLEEDCSEENIKICFNSGDCDINVNYYIGYVEKNKEKVYFEGDALMYAGIFADSDVYECQLKRLMKRADNLALLYRDKAMFISRTGCNSNLNLLTLSNSVESLSSSANLGLINPIVEDIKEKNEFANCKLW
jgi:hypothetical protein